MAGIEYGLPKDVDEMVDMLAAYYGAIDLIAMQQKISAKISMEVVDNVMELSFPGLKQQNSERRTERGY